MKTVRTSLSVKALIIATTFGLIAMQSGVAHAAVKKITCYKGTQIKVVTTAKCPAGWTTKKPAATGSTIAFNGTYSGTVSLAWNDGYVQVTSVKATGTGTVGDLADLAGEGSAAPASQCDTFSGTGVLGTGANTLKVAFDSSAKGCAADDSAPTKITFSGNAVIKSGTGKYAGATGVFKVAGSFNVKSIAVGSKESDAMTMTASGTIKLK